MLDTNSCKLSYEFLDIYKDVKISNTVFYKIKVIVSKFYKLLKYLQRNLDIKYYFYQSKSDREQSFSRSTHNIDQSAVQRHSWQSNTSQENPHHPLF